MQDRGFVDLPSAARRDKAFRAQALHFCVSIRRYVTHAGLVGQAPRSAEVGDQGAIFEGFPAPIILREEADNHTIVARFTVPVYGVVRRTIFLREDEHDPTEVGIAVDKHRNSVVWSHEVSTFRRFASGRKGRI
jgi:hypothetical protein